MSNNNEIDFTTLNWVKQELEDTLKQARQSLESYVEDPQDASLMRFCASYLHQVQGTLRMVELYGAAMVVEEMERLAQGILDGKVKQSEESYQILMRGMLQVPDYLDRLQSGHRDIPIVLLPLLNDLRACRGEKLLTETALFSPDLSRQLPEQAHGPASPLPEPVLKANAGRLRMAFQLGLLKWFKGDDPSGNTGRLALVLERLQSATTQTDARRLWWTGAGLLDAVRAEKVDSSVSVKLLVGRVDREIKHLVDSGEAYFAKHPPLELTKNLLYYLAQAEDCGPRVEAIQTLYDLGALLPSADELEHARGVMSGANRALLGTVGDAIKEDVLRVKDGLDLFLRGGTENGAELEPQSDALQRVADTLGMLGLGVPRRLVLDQKEVVDQVVAGQRPAEESTLLDVAGALLYVESSLDDHIARLGRDVDHGRADDSALELPQAEVQRILEATMKEAQGNVQQAKQDIVAFIESPWDHSKIEQIPQLLEEIGGALRMLNLAEPAALLHGITRFVDMELLKYRRVPSGDQLDLLADALASIEYYMEALRDQRGGRDKILEVTRRSLEDLGYWPIPDMLEESAEAAEDGAEHDAQPAAATVSDFPTFGGDLSPAAEESGELSPQDSEQMPTIDLPPIEAQAPEVVSEDVPADDQDQAEQELRSAVEIAPGEGLEALIVGELGEAPAPSTTSVDGLSFEQTELESDRPAEPELDPDNAVEQTLLSAADGESSEATLSFDFELQTTEPEAAVADLQSTESEEETAAEAETGEPALDAEFEFELAPMDAEDQASDAESVEAIELTAEDLALDEPEAPVELTAEVEAESAAETESDFSFELDSASDDEEAVEISVEFDAAGDSEPEELTLAEPSAEAEAEVELTEPAEEPSAEVALEPVPEPAPAPETAPLAPANQPPANTFALPDASFQAVPSDEIDEEIREVFVEEVQDELDNLNRQYPAWVADQSDAEKLKPVRRSFHTLKGSGRLVGALAIGEFSWKIENMLNRLLDKTIEVSPALLDLMENAIAALPELLAALRDEGPPKSNIGAMMWCADRLAAGEEAWLPKDEPVPSPAEETDAAQRAGEIDAEAAAAVDADESAATESADDAEHTLTNSDQAPEQPETEEAAGAADELGYGSESPLGGDPMLREILRSEVAAHLQTIRDYLEQWYEAGEPSVVSEDLLRAVHTLNGAVSMVDLPGIAGLVAPLEGYLKRARGHDLQLDRRAADLLTESADAIDDCMEKLEAGEPLPDLTQLTDEAVALKDDLPAIERGYQAFGIQLSEELAASEDGAAEVAEDSAAADEEAPAEAAERPWYEADVEGEFAEEIDELITSEADAEVVSSEESPGDQPQELAADEVSSESVPWYEVPESEVLEEEQAEFDAGIEAIETDDAAAQPVIDDSAAELSVEELDLEVGLSDATDAEELEAAESEPVAEPVEEIEVSDSTELSDVTEFEQISPLADVSEVAEVSELSLSAEQEPELEDDLELTELTELTDLAELSDEPGEEANLTDGGASDELDELQSLADLGESIEVETESEPAEEEPVIAEGEVEDAVFDALEDLDQLDVDSETGDAEATSIDLSDEPELESEEVPAVDLDFLSEAEGTAEASGSTDGASEEMGADESGAESGSELEASPEQASSASPITAEFDLDQLRQLSSRDNAQEAPAEVDWDHAVEADAGSIEIEHGVSAQEIAMLEPLSPPEATADALAGDGDSDDWDVPELDLELTESPEVDESIRFDTIEAQFQRAEREAFGDDLQEPAPVQEEEAIQAELKPETAEIDAAPAEPMDIVIAEPAARPRMPVDEHPDQPLESTDLDGELLEIFLQEGTEILDLSDGLMAKLRQNPEDREIVTELQRELHTLKGGARMAGLAPIGDLSHAMESLFEAVVEGRTSNAAVQHIEVLEHAFDSLHRMVQRVQQGRAIASPDNTIDVLDQLIRGETPTFQTEAPAAPAAASADAPAVEGVASEAAPTTVQPPRRHALRRTKHDEEEPGQRIQQEVIRVRADLIDNLVNFAGEVSIYRSRLEAQIGGFRFNLVEFDQTVTRLREQLRKLEMETEAQILSRYQREMEHLPGDPEFDPLELDRFSTLQQLSRALAESVSDLMSLQNLMDDIARQSETLLLQQSRVSSDLQEGLMRTRMVPFESLVPRLRRIMRQTTGELGKRAQLKVEGAQGEMDRTVLERMTAPMEHMLRNALAHGLESPSQRLAIGKNEEGTVSLVVSRDATEVVIRVSDDGRGMDRDAIRAKAIERGLLREDTVLSDRDLYQFVLETGFSTAQEVSKIAGRGVGMDVVNSEIKQLGGSLQIDSERGKGTTFIVRLPFTLAVTQAILVKLADVTFAVPMTSIQGVMRINRKELERRLIEQELEVTYGGENYQIYDLGELLGNPVTHTVEEGQIPLLMTRTGDQRGAIRISSVVGSREVVVKSVGPQLSAVPGFFGATIMGDGSVVVILDLAPLVRHGAALRQAPELAAELEMEQPVAPAPVRRAPLVMVVDDSITMRKVTSRVLERNELDVVTAKDGMDAVEQLQDKIPDVMLLDIEMPRMDGYELATYMKNDPRLRHVPIIMITSRTGEKHRQRALEIGVERYLGKPYQEGDLLKNVHEALGQGVTDGAS